MQFRRHRPHLDSECRRTLVRIFSHCYDLSLCGSLSTSGDGAGDRKAHVRNPDVAGSTGDVHKQIIASGSGVDGCTLDSEKQNTIVNAVPTAEGEKVPCFVEINPSSGDVCAKVLSPLHRKGSVDSDHRELLPQFAEHPAPKNAEYDRNLSLVVSVTDVDVIACRNEGGALCGNTRSHTPKPTRASADDAMFDSIEKHLQNEATQSDALKPAGESGDDELFVSIENHLQNETDGLTVAIPIDSSDDSEFLRNMIADFSGLLDTPDCHGDALPTEVRGSESLENIGCTETLASKMEQYVAVSLPLSHHDGEEVSHKETDKGNSTPDPSHSAAFLEFEEAEEGEIAGEKQDMDIDEGSQEKNFKCEDRSAGNQMPVEVLVDQRFPNKKDYDYGFVYAKPSQEVDISASEDEDLSEDDQTPAQEAPKDDKKRKRVLTEARKAKRKKMKNIKRAKKEREQGVNWLRLPPVMKPKVVKYCNFYLKGRCLQGELCKFSHDITPLTKSKPCTHFACGSCLKGDDCPYDHELSKYPCHSFVSKGTCFRGGSCKFSHAMALAESATPVPELKKAGEPIAPALSNNNPKKDETLAPPKAPLKAPKGVRFLAIGKRQQNFGIQKQDKTAQTNKLSEVINQSNQVLPLNDVVPLPSAQTMDKSNSAKEDAFMIFDEFLFGLEN